MKRVLKSKVFATIMMMLIMCGFNGSNVNAAEIMLPEVGNDTVGYHVYGAKRAGRTEFTADKVTKVIFADTAPSSPYASWDISSTDGAGEVMSYLVQDTAKSGYYIQYIVAADTIYLTHSSTDTTASFFKKYEYLTAIENIKKLNTSKMTSLSGMFKDCVRLTTIDLSSFDTSNVTNMSYMFHNCTNLKSVNLSSFNTSKVTRMEYMFAMCPAITTLDLSHFDTTNLKYMGYMFYYCYQLTTLDVSSFNTSKVVDMSYTFYRCERVPTLDVSGFDTSNVTNMAFMFDECRNLTVLDVSGFDTSKVTNMSYMFCCCEKVSTLDVTGFNTSNVTNMAAMFGGNSALTTLNVSGFDTSNVTNMASMFTSCSSLTSIAVSDFDTSKVTNMSRMFSGCTGLTTINVSNFITDNVTNMYAMFSSTGISSSIDLTNFNTSKVTDMGHMFSDCDNLTTIDLGEFDTSSVTTMEWMFYHCDTLKTLNLSAFNTSNVESMVGMFKDCIALTSLNLGSNFYASKLTTTASMFEGCSALPNLSFGNNFNSSLVTSMNNMFTGCSSLTSLNFGTAFNTSSVTNMKAMFADCSKLQTIDLSKFDTSKVENFEVMFKGCTALTTLDASGLDTSSAKKMDFMFSDCESLTTLNLAKFNTAALDDSEGSTQWSDDGSYAKNMDGLFYNAKSLQILILGENVGRIDGKHMFYNTALQKIISKKAAESESDVMDVSDNTSLDTCTNATLYVLKPAYEENYEKNSVYMDALGAERIQPIIKILGENPVNIIIGNTYTDAGVTVAGYATDNLGYLNSAGFTFTTQENVNTSTVGTGKVTYTLSWKNANGVTNTYSEIRTVNVTPVPKLMQRGDTNYMLGASADTPEYTADAVTKVIFARTAPSGAVDSWDVSASEAPNSVMSYIVLSKEENSKKYYDQYIVADYTIEMTSGMNLFYGYTSLTEIQNLSQLITTNVKNMNRMFYSCQSLTSLELDSFDTSSVLDMGYMFLSCSALTSLDVTTFETNAVTSMEGMFAGCTSLTSLNLTGLETNAVTSMASMFANCTDLTSLNLTGFETNAVTSMASMFAGCTGLTSLNLTGLETNAVTTMVSMFEGCTSLTSLDVTGVETSAVTTMTNMFAGCSALASLDLSTFNTGNVLTMSDMFNGCTSLKSLNLSNFDTSKVTNMAYMFQNCSSLTSLNVSSFDTTNVTTMASLFNGCSKLSSLEVKNFNTSNVTTMTEMFNNCAALTFLDLRNFDTQKLTKAQVMFRGCSNLECLILGQNFKKINSSQMFTGTNKLEKLISLSPTMMTPTGNNGIGQLSTRVLYVPTKTLETEYKGAYASLMSTDNIKSIMSIVGENPISVGGGSLYTQAEDAGVKVCDWEEEANYNPLGFTVATTGLPVVTSVPATKTVTYRLYFANTDGTKILVDTQTRTVNVTEGNYIVNSKHYQTLEKAIAAVNGIGTINLVKDYTDSSVAVIPSSKTITLNVGTFTLTKTGTNIENQGTLTIEGTGTICALDEGDTSLGSVIKNDSNLTIKNCTIINYTKAPAIISETANVVIGDSSNGIESTPVIIGGEYAINSAMGFDFYDGILKGGTNAFLGNINNTMPECVVSFGEDEIDGKLYQTAALSTYLMIREYELDANNVPFVTYTIGAEEADYTTYTSEMIENISFVNYITTDSTVDKWDVSNAQNNGIQAWVTDSDSNGLYDLYIGSNGDIRVLPEGFEMLFASYKNCTNINGLDSLKYESIASLYGTFCGDENLSELNLESWITDSVSNMSYTFAGCVSLREVQLSNIETELVTTFESTFDGCNSLNSLDVSHFDTASAETTKAMFRDCQLLTTISVDSWNTEVVEDMSYMFANCGALNSINVSALEFGNVNTLEAMFTNCTSLSGLEFNITDSTDNLENMSRIFKGCSNLANINFINLNVSNVKNASGMFEGCTLLSILDLHTLNFANIDDSYTYSENGINYAGKNMMFANCENLDTILISEDFNGLNGENMFSSCSSLKAIITNDAVTQSSEIINLSTDTGIKDIDMAVLYVPDLLSESVYENNNNYKTEFGADRIKPLLELVGEQRISISQGDTYQELGYLVANKFIDEIGIEGYDVTITGVDKIDTSKMQVYEVTYTLTYTDPETSTTKTLMTLIREVQIGEITLNIFVSGVNEYDSTLTVNVMSSSIDEENFTYQWYWNSTNDTENGTLIDGANEKLYTIGQGLVGKYIYVKVIASLDNYEDTVVYDITDAEINASATVRKKTITTPVADKNFTYDGTEQTFSDELYIEKYMSVSGNTATDAGNYVATFTLKQPDDCCWSTTTDASVDVGWNISPKAIAVVWDGPFEFVYDGNSQGPELHAVTSIAGETAVLTRTTEINVGTYLSVATLSEIIGGRANVNNYVLLNDNVLYEITKATPVFKVTPTNLSLTEGNMGVLTYESNIDGLVTATSANESVVSVGNINSIDKTIEVISESDGSTTISVTLNETNNYNAVTVLVTVGTLDAKYTDGISYYETLKDAFNGVETNGVIMVLTDVNETNVAVLDADKNVTLTFNTHTLTANVNDFVTIKGTLTLEGEGSIVAGNSITNLVNIDAGTLNMGSGVVLEGYDTTISNNVGKFNMNGGSLTQNNSASTNAVLYVSEGATANINEGTIISANSGVAIENKGITNAINSDDTLVIENLSGGNEVIINEGTLFISGAILKGQILNTSTEGLNLESSTITVTDGYAVSSSQGSIFLTNVNMTGTRLLELSTSDTNASLAQVSASTTEDAISMQNSVIEIYEGSNIISAGSVIETFGDVGINNSTLESTSSDVSDFVIKVNEGTTVIIDNSNVISNLATAIVNDGEAVLINGSNVSSLSDVTVLNSSTLTCEAATLKNEKIAGGISLDNDGTTVLTNSTVSSKGTAIDNSRNMTITSSNIISESGTAIKTTGIMDVMEGTEISGANGIENSGTLTFGIKDGAILRDIVKVVAVGTAVKNDDTFNWNDGEITGNAATIYVGNDPIIEEKVAIAKETNGSQETRYVVIDTEAPIIEELISETDWVKNSQTIQVIAKDNVRVDGYAITEDNVKPDANSEVWSDNNTFIVNENKVYYIWVKDNADNIVGQEFLAKWICLEIWDTTGASGADTRAILHVDGRLVFEVKPRALGTDYAATGVIKDYTVSNAEWSNDSRVTSVTVSEGITAIGNYGLSNLPSANSISISVTVETIAESAMYRTNNYSEIILTGGNSSFVNEGLALYDTEKTILYSYSSKNTDSIFVIPDTVKTLVTGVFYDNTALDEIRTCKNIINIGEDAFEFVSGDVYYYTSTYEMKTYAINNETEANFIPIDDVKPVIESFVINDDEVATTNNNVTLTINATDDTAVTQIFTTETYYTDADVAQLEDNLWNTYSGNTYSFELSSNEGNKTIYVWVKDAAGNISDIAKDDIYYGRIEFELYGQEEIVQYVDESGRDYYKYNEEVQGGCTQLENITLDVTGTVNHRVVGTYSIQYGITVDGTLMQSKTRIVDIIENAWTGATGVTDDGYGYIIHANGKYAKITTYSEATVETLTIPEYISHNGAEYKVIDVGSLVAESNIFGTDINSTVKTIVLPETIINIGENAFRGFTTLENINIPSAVMSISNNALNGAGTAAGVNIELTNNFRELKDNALLNATVASIDFGVAIRNIGAGAFANVNVPSGFVLDISASLDAIGDGAFESTNIYDINVDIDNQKFIIDSSDTALLAEEGETLILYPIDSDFEEYVIDEGIITIKSKAFKDAKNIKYITLSSTVTNIESYAFKNTTNLKEVISSNVATSIGEYAFADSGISAIELNSGLVSIETGTFENTKLEFISIPKNVATIKEDALKGISTLRSVVIESKTDIESNAFENCTNLDCMMFTNNNGIVSIADKTAIPEDTTLYVPSSMESLYEGDSVYMTYTNYTEMIRPIIKLVGEQEIVWLLNTPYVESGVELVDELMTLPGESSKIEGLELVIEGSIDTTKSERTIISYIAKYNGVEVNRVERTVDIEDTEAPVIVNVTTDTDWVSPQQTFVVEATDNIGVTHYIITETNTIPELDDSRWQTSNNLKVATNGTWYIFVKDNAGNISERKQVVASWIAAAIWDVSKNQDNTVRAIVTVDGKELIIKGVGETIDYSTSETPWNGDYGDTITKVTVESGVTSIGDYLLGDLPNVETIDLPNTVSNVSDSAFAHTNSFENINLNGNTYLEYENGTLYDSEKTKVYVHTNSYTTDYELPASVIKICEAAFENNIYISNLDLTNVKEIQSEAFKDCTHLTNQYIPKTLESIGTNVFAGTHGPVYYYSSCDVMVEYVITYGTETQFIEIDDVKPVIKNFTINDNEAITRDPNVTLQIEATDNKEIIKIIIETTQSNNLTSGDSRWQDYTGESEISYTFTGENGIRTIYIWVMDASGNISNVASDSIMLGENDFSFEYNDDIVQYVDTTPNNYYKFNEEVQGKYFVTTEGFTVSVNSDIDVTKVGEQQVVYSLLYNGTIVGEFYKNVDVIEDAWEAEVFEENGFSFVKHITKNYAKIVKYSDSNTVVFPSTVVENGVSYKVIEIESLDSNSVVPTTVTSITLPNTIISIGKNAFVGCVGITSVDLKENVMTIEENAFKGTGLTTLDLKKNIREVKESAFENTKIENLTLSMLLKNIEESAFANALDVNELNLLDTIDNIAEAAFAGSKIDSMTISNTDADSKFAVIDAKILINTNTNTLLQYATGIADTRFEYNMNSVQRIGDGAFKNATNLTEILIGDTYTQIGEEAFRNTSLVNFQVSTGVSEISEYAFADIETLEMIVLNEVTNIKSNAFSNDIALETLVILTDIDNICEIDDATQLPSVTKVYVLSKEAYSSVTEWLAISDRIYDIFRLNDGEETTVEAGFAYVESGVYAVDTLFTSTNTYPYFENIKIEISGDVDTSVLGSVNVLYELKVNEAIKASLTRKITVVDTIAPRIESVNKLDEPQALRERFTIIASDNHRIAGYAITKDSAQPVINSSLWNESNIVYADQNGLWHVWVKDEAGNVSETTIEATNICTAKWDIGIIPNTVFGVITLDNTLVIEGVGGVKYFAPLDIPWVGYNEVIGKIEVKEGVTSLEKCTLGYLKNVTEISLPSTLTKVETSTFMKTNNFDTLIFPNGTNTFVYEEYNLYSADKSILYVHSNKDTKTLYVIDGNVTIIAEYAFDSNANIVEITTSSNPTLLMGAFSGASTLETISGDIGGTKIGANAFENCTKLKDIQISKDIEIVGSYAFSNCNMITKIELDRCSNLTTLEHHAFANLNNMKEMIIYKTITQITADENGVRNAFENMGSNFVENAKVYYYEGCTAMEEYAEKYADVNVDFILIDQMGPRMEKLTIINHENGTYAADTVLEIVVEMTEEFVTYKGIIPSLSIAFGDGQEIDLGVGVVVGKTLEYSYVIKPSDFGELKGVSFVGELYDLLDNKTEFDSPIAFDKQIIARTGVILESEAEETKYFTHLSGAAEYITSNGNITMLLDENLDKTVEFKPNTVVSLNINSKKITFNTEASNSLIINKGILDITDAGAGILTINSSARGEISVISNEGVLQLAKGILRAQGYENVKVYGVYNHENAVFTVKGGTVEGINNGGTSYGVMNEGTLNVDGGNVQSSTISGMTYAVYNRGTTNILNGQVAARISNGTKGETVGVYIESGKCIIGNDDDNISSDNPVIYSTKDGLKNEGGSLEFYDGFIEGQAYRSLYTDDVKVVSGYALVRRIVGDREKALLDIDREKPTIKLTNLTPDWTNDSVTVEAYIIDEESGIKKVEHKGETLELVNNKVTIKVYENSTLTFTATDFAGNVSEESIEITNIDKIVPTFENLIYGALANAEEVTAEVTIRDNASGVVGYAFSKLDAEPKEWTKLDRATLTANVTSQITSNGKYYLYAIDDAGNIARYPQEIDITTVDMKAPTIESFEILDDGKGFVNSSIVMLKIEATDDTGVEELLLSNTLLTNNQALNSDDWVPYTEEAVWELEIGDGAKTVYAWVKDRVGKISNVASDTTKLLAQYIGNNGTNSTTFKLIAKDGNYNFEKELTKAGLYIKVKDQSGVETYRGSYGENIVMEKAPVVYGPVQEGNRVMSGRYYFLTTTNLEGAGIVYICLDESMEVDKAGNTVLANKLDIATDVVIELEAPYITIGNTQISVFDTDAHALGVIRVNGQTIKLQNGVITKEELETTYGITLTTGTIIEAFDKCGNVAKQTIS